MNVYADAASRAAHRAAREALPWLLNGSLDSVERDAVQAHVQSCVVCREELEMLRALRRAGSLHPVPSFDPERALARMLPRIDDIATGPPQKGAAPGMLQRWRERLAANDGTWLRRATLAQSAVIASLLVALIWPAAPGNDAYHVLGASAHPQARLIVVFRPDTTERELRRILRSSGLRIVNGPTVTDAYLVNANGSAGAAVVRLRAEPAVLLAEPLGPEGLP
jgi:hypothetical protein